MICETCALSRPSGETRFDLPAPWLYCALLKSWEYRSPFMPCKFSPSRYEEKKEVKK